MTSRYSRQIALPQVGTAGQARIAATSVLVVGAGGLGCIALPYLAAAGVGQLAIVDHDRVEASNLHRQPLYRTRDRGRPKAQVARQRLLEMEVPGVRVDAADERLTPANAAAFVADAQIVVDAADSFAVTVVLSDACAAAGRPLVSASVAGFSGYVGAFCGGAPGYRAVFPEPPTDGATCAGAGVLGTAVAVVGALQAQVVLSLALALQPSPLGRLLSVDLLGDMRFGGFSFRAAPEPHDTGFAFIAPSAITRHDHVIELRDALEAPEPVCPAAARIDAGGIGSAARTIPRSGRVVLCCRSGLRAWRAATALRALGYGDLALIAAGG